MSRWEPRAIIVLVLAVAIATAVVLAMLAMAWWGRGLSEVGGEVMIAVLGAVIAIIAGFISSNKPPSPPEDKDDAIPKDGEG